MPGPQRRRPLRQMPLMRSPASRPARASMRAHQVAPEFNGMVRRHACLCVPARRQGWPTAAPNPRPILPPRSDPYMRIPIPSCPPSRKKSFRKFHLPNGIAEAAPASCGFPVDASVCSDFAFYLPTRWLAGSKEVLMGAFGVPTWPAEMPAEKLDREGGLGLVSEGEARDYLERALEQIRNSGMMGAMFKGLQRGPISAQWPEWIDVSLEEYGQDPSGQIRRLYRRYRECAQGTF